MGDVAILEGTTVASGIRQPSPEPQAVPTSLPSAAGGGRATEQPGNRATEQPNNRATTLTDIHIWPPHSTDNTWPHLSDPPEIINDLLQIDDNCTFFLPPIHISLMTQTEESQQLLKSIKRCADIPSPLLFHQILPIHCNTRASSSKMQKQLDEEFVLMSNPPPPTHTPGPDHR